MNSVLIAGLGYPTAKRLKSRGVDYVVTLFNERYCSCQPHSAVQVLLSVSKRRRPRYQLSERNVEFLRFQICISIADKKKAGIRAGPFRYFFFVSP